MFRRAASTVWKYKKTTVFAVGLTYGGYRIYKALHSQAVVDIRPQTVLTWRIVDGLIVESPTFYDMGGSAFLNEMLNEKLRDTDEVSMVEALMSLEMAAKDPRIEAIAIDLTTNSKKSRGSAGSAGISMAQAQELRTALLSFREQKQQQHGPDGGRVYFYVDSFDNQATYYLASACSDIIVQPTGFVPLTGITTQHFFVRRLLDKLGVKPVTETRKDFKSVLSTLTESAIPEKQRENNSRLLASLNEMLVADIASVKREGAAQPLTKEIVRAAMVEGPLLAPEAVNRNLISRCGYALDVDSVIGPRSRCGISAYRLARGVETSEANWEDNTTVGLVFLLGTIDRTGINSAKFVAESLIKTAMDPSVSAVVFRIDSGGGDPVASDTIACAIDHIQNTIGKPVVASYGTMAASGAIFASAMCRKIFADPATITGSIGVASIRPIITKKLLDYVGFDIEEMRSVDNRSGSLIEEPSGAELQRYKKLVDAMYDDFVGRIAKGRNYSAEEAEAVAQGQVFTGAQAKENGLVDELGGLTRAIEAAAQLGRCPSGDKYKADITENICVKVTPVKTQFKPWQQLNPTATQMLQAEIEHILLQGNPPQVEAKLDNIYFK
ncbi:hypothetical protein GGI23_000078 [Coemansia sp. RSA 2559]|nr:hypothetical protein GGI23_000078 [Coemansia sp. RSA 2559]KAJ2869682.1 hypothetical protein GGI22_000082 [Coemansia erecta]